MKTNNYFFVVLTSLSLIMSCNDNKTSNVSINNKIVYPPKQKVEYSSEAYNNTKGYYNNGEIIKEFDCPDDKNFPPVDIKSWKKIPVVNDRLPTYEETTNGTAIFHYGEKKNSVIKPFYMSLPKLAYITNPLTKLSEIVIIIQIVQTANDTIVGYRHLAGGCGGSLFHNFKFLTENELKKEMLF
jgi:hypothetical protein